MLTLGNRRWLIIVSVAVALAALTSISYFIPMQYDICEKNEHTDQKDCTAYHIPLFIVLYVGEFLEDHAGAVTAIATCFIAWFTWTLQVATISQGKLTKEALIADKKAFIFASGILPLYDPIAGGALARARQVRDIRPDSTHALPRIWVINTVFKRVI